MPRWWTTARDVLLFLAGLAGVAHETLIHSGGDRLGLLALFAAMLGLPYALRLDQHRQDGQGGAPAPPEPPQPPADPTRSDR